MQNVLVVSNTTKNINDFLQILAVDKNLKLSSANSCYEASLKVESENFDILIVNAPLCDESGVDFAKKVVQENHAQVIFIVPEKNIQKVSEILEEFGIFVIARPISANMFWTAIRLAKATQNKMKKLKEKNDQLKEKLADIKLVDKAKIWLVLHENMTEEQAHRHIEKRAMDERTTKKQVAEKILKLGD